MASSTCTPQNWCGIEQVKLSELTKITVIRSFNEMLYKNVIAVFGTSLNKVEKINLMFSQLSSIQSVIRYTEHKHSVNMLVFDKHA